VRELNPGDASLFLHEVGDPPQSGNLLIAPEAEIFGRNPPLGQYGGGFGEDQTGPTDRAAAEVDELPVVGEAIVVGILAHWRDHDPVGERDRADGQWGEQG